jgi:ADP-ribose pyrophosphatase
MLALDQKNRILLVRQFRLPAAKDLWELPAGRLDRGEKPLAAARRELKEETGYQARKWKRLVSFWPSPGYVGEHMTIFLATDLTAGEAHPMEDEHIECRWFKRKQVDHLIRDGKIEDGKTMIGFLTWMRYWK